MATERRKKYASSKGKTKKPTNKKFAKRFPKTRSSVAETLRENVRRLRKDLELSQSDLAKAIGTDQAAIGLIELSRANPTLLTIEKIAQVLQTTAVDLLTKHNRRRERTTKIDP